MSEFPNDAPPLVGSIPREHYNSLLENYVPADEAGTYALALCRRMIELEEGPGGLLLVGAAGNGKTHLAIGTAREIVRRGGRAAFVRFQGNTIDSDTIPRAESYTSHHWWGQEEGLVSSFDLIVIDDLPGNMYPGVQKHLQQIVLATYDNAKRLILTSNRPVDEIVLQMMVPEVSHTHKIVGVTERIKQTFQVVEFAGESFRGQQPKWWAGILRPADLPDTLAGLDPAGIEQYVRNKQIVLLAQAIMELAARTGTKGTALGAVRQLLDDLRRLTQ